MVSQIHKLPQRHFSENRENIVFMVTYIFRQSCFFEICALCLWWINFILFNSFFNLSVFYIISQSTKCLWNTVAGRLSFLAFNLARYVAWVVPGILCSLRWCAGVFLTFKECLLLFNPLLFLGIF